MCKFLGFLRQNLGKYPESTKELSYKALVRLIWNMPAQFETPGKGNTSHKLRLFNNIPYISCRIAGNVNLEL